MDWRFIQKRIAREAARLLFTRVETAYFPAKCRAAARLGFDFRHHPGALPSDRRIKDELTHMSRRRRSENTDTAETDDGRTIDAGQAIAESISDTAAHHRPARVDRFVLWTALLGPLERVKQDPRRHPEGDALYHSLQAFELAREEMPYDQEMMTAALLHDVGKAIDPRDHVPAGLAALYGTLTPREEFLIANHAYAPDAEGRRAGGPATSRKGSEWYEDLLTLREIDVRARQRGAQVCTIDEAINHLRAMDAETD